MRTIRVVAFSGSLRARSFNTALLRAAQKFSPPNVAIDLFDLQFVPMYNDDIRAEYAAKSVGGEMTWPEPVAKLRDAIAKADALLFATPEYNFSIPAVLKNAIDWASRSPDPPLAEKPAAIMSAATGNQGGVRAQMHLRQVFVYTDVFPINKPEVLVARAQEKFDEHLKLIDVATQKMITAQLIALATWTERIHPKP